MKIYKCKGSRESSWIEIESDDPEIAAEAYAEEMGLKQGAIVAVWGVGKFRVISIHTEPVYIMAKV